MKLSRVFYSCAMLLASSASVAYAEVVNWTIDSTQSWVRLTVPDQIINIGGGNVIEAYLRDQGGPIPTPPAWTDAGKRFAEVSGTIASDMTPTSISFTSGAHSAPAFASGMWRPNAASWDDVNDTFNSGLGATDPSVFAANLTSSGILSIGYLNFYNVTTDYVGTATGLSNYAGTGAGSLTLGGSAGATMDLDAFLVIGDSRTILPTLSGPATLGETLTNNPNNTPPHLPAPSGVLANSLTISNTGGQNRQMIITYTVSFEVEINDLPVDTFIESRIVANATIPSPAPTLVNARPLHNAYVGADKVDTGVSLIQRGAAPQQAQLTNIISSTQGINGVVLDFDNLAALGDITLEYKMSPQNVFATPIQDWVNAPAPASATLLPNAGQAGSDRVAITWANGSITNRYLCIKVIFGGNTIAELYLGHLRGEMTGASGGKFTVLVGDILAVRTDLTQAKTASGRTDVDKSNTVLVQDILDTRSNLAQELTQVTIPANP